MTGEELAQEEEIVNEAIKKKIDVVLEEMTPREAYAAGAIGGFPKSMGSG